MPELKPKWHTDDGNDDLEDFAVDMHEWLSLIALGSPRIDPDDHLDPFLSRYTSPGNVNERIELVKISWHGFMCSSWVHRTFVQLIAATAKDAWFAYDVGGFVDTWPTESKLCTILRVPDAQSEYVLWEPA